MLYIIDRRYFHFYFVKIHKNNKIMGFLGLAIVGYILTIQINSLTVTEPQTQLRAVQSQNPQNNISGISQRSYDDTLQKEHSLVNLLLNQALVSQLGKLINKNEGEKIQVAGSSASSLPAADSTQTTTTEQNKTNTQSANNDSFSLPIIGVINEDTRKNYGWLFFIIGVLMFLLPFPIIVANQKKCAKDSYRFDISRKIIQQVDPNNKQSIQNAKDKLVYVTGQIAQCLLQKQVPIQDTITGVIVQHCLRLNRKVQIRKKQINFLTQRNDLVWAQQTPDLIRTILNMNLISRLSGGDQNEQQVSQPVITTMQFIHKNLKIGMYEVGDSLKDDIETDEQFQVTKEHANKLLERFNKNKDKPQYECQVKNKALLLHKVGQSADTLGSYRITYKYSLLGQVSVIARSMTVKLPDKVLYSLQPFPIDKAANKNQLEDIPDQSSFLVSFRIAQYYFKPINRLQCMAKGHSSKQQMLNNMINNNSLKQYLVRLVCYVLMVFGLTSAIALPFFAISLLKNEGWWILLVLAIFCLVIFFIVLFISWAIYAKNKWVVMMGVIIILIVIGVIVFFIVKGVGNNNNNGAVNKIKL